VEGRLSRLYLRTRWRILFAPKEVHAGFFPPWLNEEFGKKFNLRERWEASTGDTVTPSNAVRPEAYKVTFAPHWPSLFEAHDPGSTRVPVEMRYPFFDLRLMSYLLGLPRLPWCSDKQLLREAARGILPDAVRLRRKSPLAADPLVRLLETPDAPESRRFEAVPELERYVIASRIPQVFEKNDPWSAWVHLRPLSLNYWLRGLSPPVINRQGGIEHELSVAGRS
jgi:asparagine synthase (glutamine-hydrolysing)